MKTKNNTKKIVEAIGNDIDHVLINYAMSVRGLVRRNKNGSFKKYGASAVFERIINAIDDPKFKSYMLNEVGVGIE